MFAIVGTARVCRGALRGPVQALRCALVPTTTRALPASCLGRRSLHASVALALPRGKRRASDSEGAEPSALDHDGTDAFAAQRFVLREQLKIERVSVEPAQLPKSPVAPMHDIRPKIGAFEDGASADAEKGEGPVPRPPRVGHFEDEGETRSKHVAEKPAPEVPQKSVPLREAERKVRDEGTRTVEGASASDSSDSSDSSSSDSESDSDSSSGSDGEGDVAKEGGDKGPSRVVSLREQRTQAATDGAASAELRGSRGPSILERLAEEDETLRKDALRPFVTAKRVEDLDAIPEYFGRTKFKPELPANAMDVREIVGHLLAMNVEHMRVVRVDDPTVLADYFVFLSGKSQRHVTAIAKDFAKMLKHRPIYGSTFSLPRRNNDYAWRIINAGNVVVHVFAHEAREYYDIERLWILGPDKDEKMQRAIRLNERAREKKD